MTINFKILYTKLANKFFFISNLSEWHFSCRKLYNQDWLKQVGYLTEKEKKALKQFKKILKKYNFRKDNYLGFLFITLSEKKVWANLKKRVSKRKFDKIRMIFKIFEPKFEQIWFKEKKNLRQAKQILNKSLKEKRIKNLINDLFLLFPKKSGYKILTFQIYLLGHLSTKYYIAGGANIGENKITIELSQITSKTGVEEKCLRVIFHEIIHAFFEKPNFREALGKFLGKQNLDKFTQTKVYQEIGSFETIINEMIVHSLLPNGYLGEKYFHLKTKERIGNIKEIEKKKIKQYQDFLKLATYYLYSTLKKYLRKKKPLDENYIAQTFRIFKKWVERK